jgi:hypothetical protein
MNVTAGAAILRFIAGFACVVCGFTRIGAHDDSLLWMTAGGAAMDGALASLRAGKATP